MGKILIIPIILLITVGVLFSFLYQKSSNLIKQGDVFVKEDRLEEALLYYKEAQSAFPLRRDVGDAIIGTQLLINSELEYSQITDQTYAEVQDIPDIAAIAPVKLQSDDFFVPILMYHHIRINPRPQDRIWAILNVSPEQLDQQLNYLATHNYHTITLDDLNNAFNGKTTLPENPIILTFDDGYETFYTNAYPLLKKYNMKATEFVITQVQNLPAYLTWDQIKEMSGSGLIDFGAHTQHHPNLPDLSQVMIDREITLSKSDLESHLGKTINWFAYPYGSYNKYILDKVAKAGYLGAVSTIYSPVQNKFKLFLLPRMGVDGRFGLDEFARRLQK